MFHFLSLKLETKTSIAPFRYIKSHYALSFTLALHKNKLQSTNLLKQTKYISKEQTDGILNKSIQFLGKMTFCIYVIKLKTFSKMAYSLQRSENKLLSYEVSKLFSKKPQKQIVHIASSYKIIKCVLQGATHI